MVRVEINLQLCQGDLEGPALAQPGMAGPALAPGVVAQVQVDPIRVEVVGGLDDVIPGEDFGRGAT